MTFYFFMENLKDINTQGLSVQDAIDFPFSETTKQITGNTAVFYSWAYERAVWQRIYSL